jgi:hypothetical protein
MPELKKLSAEGVPSALEKAERYRLLNEPWAAESICHDILDIEPSNQRALVELVLSLTEQFGSSSAAPASEARKFVDQMKDAYSRAYYRGIIAERMAKARLGRTGPGSGSGAYEFLHDAMDAYEEAQKVHPAGDDSAILRYNTCVRMLQRFPNLRPSPEHSHSMLE